MCKLLKGFPELLRVTRISLDRLASRHFNHHGQVVGSFKFEVLGQFESLLLESMSPFFWPNLGHVGVLHRHW
jgi:hypothetical protein